MRFETPRLLPDRQLIALQNSQLEKLRREPSGWLAPEAGNMYRPSTISSLWHKGLLDADFWGPEVFRTAAEVIAIGGWPRCRHVWCNERGLILLRWHDWMGDKIGSTDVATLLQTFRREIGGRH